MLDRTRFLVKKYDGSYPGATAIHDIYDLESGEQIGQAREVLHPVFRVLRLGWTNLNFFLPTTVAVSEGLDGSALFDLKGAPVFGRYVSVRGADGGELGAVERKRFSTTAAFSIRDFTGAEIATARGTRDWRKAYDVVDPGGNRLATFTYHWQGVGKEIAEDDLVIAIEARKTRVVTALLLGAGLAINIM